VLQTWPDQRIICIVDVKELVAQNYEKLIGLWNSAPAGIYSAGLRKRNVHEKIIFAGIQSVYNKAFTFQKCDVLIVDEAHGIPPEGDGMYQQFISELKEINPKMIVIGFTATAYRLKTGLLHTGENALFDGICYEYDMATAIND